MILSLIPGLDLEKKPEHNYRLLYQLNYFRQLNVPVLVGISRKSMIYRPLDKKPEDVLHAVAALHWEALVQGADILRVHDVPEAVDIIKLFTDTYVFRQPPDDMSFT
jgi:dihydropteroate synthase